MATEDPKSPSTSDQSQLAQYPQQFPGPFPPHLFFQPPPQDGADPNAPPYMLYPQGIMYAYPPNAPFPYPNPPPPTASELRQKRKQVKTACTNCATACKRCDSTRPCERCEKYGIAPTCVDGQRKERQKGVKRGPYKRKNKASSNANAVGFSGPSVEWPNHAIDPAAMSQPPLPFPSAADGSVQYYYPNVPFFALPNPDPGGNPASGSADPNQPPTMMPLMLHPSAFSCPPHPYASTGYPPAMMGMPMPPPPPSDPPSLSPSLSEVPERVQSMEPSGSVTTEASESTAASPFALSSTTGPPSPPPDLDDPTQVPEIRVEPDHDEDDDDMEPVILSKS
ncbi:hypothetical protein BDV98DRAFT_604360 [Pterulicium gracile]|uniref:Zn(2)-C6 fungal-type domain-containing protein n=1 Tax=Pterulicium gracile TaxID=1884261 RepID=A0A5C3QIU6_9AGAR|nr:hypothetical protein BDV98DRAFT_604360 [Pterula gracilis]